MNEGNYSNVNFVPKAVLRKLFLIVMLNQFMKVKIIQVWAMWLQLFSKTDLIHYIALVHEGMTILMWTFFT